MQLFQSLFLGAAALATMVSAQGGNIAFTSVPTSVTAGQQATITYSGGEGGPVTIRLRQGDPGNLATIGEPLTTTASGGTFSWTPDTSLPSGTNYALEISQGSTVNYSGLISVAGGGSPSASSSISASASSSSESASSSASSASSAISSIISSVSSALNSSIAATTTTPVGSLSTGGTTMGRNTTMVSPTLSATTTTNTEESTATSGSASGTSTASGTGAPSTNAAAGLASPLALVLSAVAAMIYLN